MKIALLANSAWYLYNFRQSLICDLLEQGHTVVAVAPPDSSVPRLVKLGAQYREVSLNPTGTHPIKELRGLLSLWVALSSIGPDLVFTFTVKGNLYGGLGRMLLRYRQVANISGLGEPFDRDDLLQKVICMLYRVSLHGAQRVFFQNVEDQELCLRKHLVAPRLCQLLPGSGVDLNRFTATPVPSRRRVFLMLGRLLVKKGYDDFLSAAAILRHSYGNRAEFWILGIPDDERGESRLLLDRILDAAERGDIRYFAGIDDVRPILNKANVVVLPSTYNEGVPRSLLEALASGKVIVTTDWKGCRTTVEPGRNGFLVSPGDLRDLVDSLKRLIELPAEKLNEMGKHSRRLAEAKFDERIVLAHYREELRSGVAQPGEKYLNPLPDQSVPLERNSL